MDQEQPLIEIVEEFIASEKTVLLPFDKNVLRIQQEIGKEEPDTRVVENLIVSDQALTSQVLRTANSAFYRGLVKVSTVHDALIRLGTTEIANIVISVTHRKQYRAKDPFVRTIMSKLWTHSAGCAVGSQWLAQRSGLKSRAHEVFIAGLLHDIGKLFVLTVIDDIKASGRINVMPSQDLIRELMVNLHTEHGYSLLKNWNLPEVYCEIALKHHEDAHDKEDTMLMVVKLANHACNKLGIGMQADPTLLLAATAEAYSLGLSEITLAELEIKLEDFVKSLSL
jgi:HD-like signal output (HDOD) protein